MQFNFLLVLIVTLLINSNRLAGLEPQVYFHLANGDEPILIENSDFSKLADESAKAVVDLQIEGSQNVYLRNSLFEHFFQAMNPESGLHVEKSISSTGSAVIINENGYLVTCGHVVENANKIKVLLPDHKIFEAKIVAKYPIIDLAILKIENLGNTKLPYLRFGSINSIKLGTFVAAVGNALNMGQTFTDGHITALKRRLKKPNALATFNVLQHNAAVNPGNSGGALVDQRGNLIGINNAMLTNAASIGFSISIDLISDYLNKFFNKIDGCWFGLYAVRPLDLNSLNNLFSSGFNYEGGLLVVDVNEDSPVKTAGLLRGDIIISINGSLIEEVDDLRIREDVLPANKEVEILIWRDGKPIKLNVTPLVVPKQKFEEFTIQGNHLLNGVKVACLTPALREQLKLPLDAQGLLVLNGLQNNMNGDFGLFNFGAIVQKGDLIVRINGEDIKSVEDVKRILQSESNDKIALNVIRDSQQIQLSFNNVPRMIQKGAQQHDGNTDEGSKENFFLQDPLNDFFGGLNKNQTHPDRGTSPSNKFDAADLLKDVPSQVA